MNININIADIICKIDGDQKIVGLIKNNCSEFLSNKKEDYIIKINLGDKIEVKEVINKNGKVVEILGEREKIIEKKDYYLINSEFFNGFVYVNKNEAEFNILDSNEYLWLMLRNLLRVCYAIISFKNNGFLVHGSCMVKDNKAYLFCGKPGTGKSTVAKLSKSKVLSDESLIIRNVKNKIFIYGTPFGGELEPLNDRGELEKILFLIQDKNTYFKKMSLHESIAEFMQNEFLSFTLIFKDNNKTVRKIFIKTSELLNRIKCYYMYFTMEDDLMKKVSKIED